MKRTICDHSQCTGCAACKEVCPRHCISMQPDSLDALYPVMDQNLCIGCGLCIKTCPNNREHEFRTPKVVWAAWSNDDKIRKTSASGGIANELYRLWIRNGGAATGVIYNRDEGCHFMLLEKESDISATQNSKYTFSDTYGIYKCVRAKLKSRKSVLFIGVPCQIAGLYGFLKDDYENLTTVDLICHGMPPYEYLRQHVEYIEKKSNECSSELCFRDPVYHTYTFTFTIKNKSGKEFYKKSAVNTDNYQIGYHHALIYRENCYQCRYACKERISDLTIGDFSGLGRFAPFEYDKRNVSCILQNTEKGSKLIELLGEHITLIRRPESEAFDVERQLKAPSVKHRERETFEEEYRQTRNFERAANIALRRDKIDNVIGMLVSRIKFIIRLFVPDAIISQLRRIKGHGL